MEPKYAPPLSAEMLSWLFGVGVGDDSIEDSGMRSVVAFTALVTVLMHRRGRFAHPPVRRAPQNIRSENNADANRTDENAYELNKRVSEI